MDQLQEQSMRVVPMIMLMAACFPPAASFASRLGIVTRAAA